MFPQRFSDPERAAIKRIPDELIGSDSVVFNGTSFLEPDELPGVSISGLPGNTASIRWEPVEARPSAPDTAGVNLSFTPVLEPGVAETNAISTARTVAEIEV